MIDGILKFPSAPSQLNTLRLLVQLRLDAKFIAVVDRRRVAQPDLPPRTKAIEKLAAIGLADQLLMAARKSKK